MSRNYYKGEKPCPGCQVPGNVKPRFTGAGGLCQDCIKAIEIGNLRLAELAKAAQEGQDPIYVVEFSRLHGNSWNEQCVGKLFPYLSSEAQDKLSKSFAKVLESIGQSKQPNAKRVTIGESYAYYTKTYITKTQFESLVQFLNEASIYTSALQKKAFNEGKNLLICLQNGTLSLKDFDDGSNRKF